MWRDYNKILSHFLNFCEKQIVKEGKKRVIGKQGDRSKVEDEEDDEGEWTRYRGKGRGKIRGLRGRGARGRGK
ncbi:unnamed protein product [Rhizophagus irregularis]|nr:unnamed protein product [Rhizophagus irregularis]